jgi:hypothetical protein
MLISHRWFNNGLLAECYRLVGFEFWWFRKLFNWSNVSKSPTGLLDTIICCHL